MARQPFDASISYRNPAKETHARKRGLRRVIGVVADLFGVRANRPPFTSRDFVSTNLLTFNALIGSMRPRVDLTIAHVDDLAGPELSIEFESMEDFSPDRLVERIEPLSRLLDRRRELEILVSLLDCRSDTEINALVRIALDVMVSKRDAAGDFKASVSKLLEELDEHEGFRTALSELRVSRAARLLDSVESVVDLILNLCLSQEVVVSVSPSKAARLEIVAIDERLSRSVNEILHDKRFRALEASWRGLEYLVRNCAVDPRIEIRVLPATKDEVVQNIGSPNDSRGDSTLFGKLRPTHDAAVFEPFAVLISDFEFSAGGDDCALLEALGDVAAEACCPVVANGASSLLGLDSWSELRRSTHWHHTNPAAISTKWKRLRCQDAAAFLVLTFPRVLARVPYGACTRSPRSFVFEEEMVADDHNSYQWASSAFVLGSQISASYLTTAVGIDPHRLGENIADLPAYSSPERDADKVGPAEALINDQDEALLLQLGLTPLLQQYNTDIVKFMGIQTLRKSEEDPSRNVSDFEMQAYCLPGMLFVSWLVHEIRALVVAQVGKISSLTELQGLLVRWLADLTVPDPAAALPIEFADRPLVSADCSVKKHEIRPGYSTVTVRVRHNSIAHGEILSAQFPIYGGE